MIKKIIIIGAGLHAEVVKNIISYKKDYKFIGYLDDYKNGVNIIGNISDIDKYINNYYFICAIGDNHIRKKQFDYIKEKGGRFINAIHPDSYIEEGVKLGEGIMIGAKTYINIASEIGKNTIINNGVIIEHHNKIGNNCHLAPGVITGGNVNIGDNVFLGLNTLINDEIKIADNVFSGTGTVINKNVNNNLKIVGIPYKIIGKVGK